MVTGLSNMGAEIGGKRLQLLRSLFQIYSALECLDGRQQSTHLASRLFRICAQPPYKVGLPRPDAYVLLSERAAFYIDKMLKGANPGELPVEQPTKFQAVVNLKTARELRLKMSSLLVAQVEEVIE
jgi:hypothetical protein